MSEFVQSEIDSFLKTKSLLELRYILEKTQLELKRRGSLHINTDDYKRDYDNIVRVINDIGYDDEDKYRAPDWCELEKFIRTLSNSLELIHYNDKNEDDDWLCYEDGESIKRVWKMPSGDLLTFKYITHSSKHTFTLHYIWEYNQNNVSFSYGTFMNSVKSTNAPFDFQEVLKSFGCSNKECSNMFYRYCLLKYLGGDDIETENMFQRDGDYDFLVEVIVY